MLKSSLRLLLLSSPKRTLLGTPKRLEISNNCCRTIVNMNEKWPVLEKRKLEDVEEAAESADAKKQRLKRKMYAICLAYCGQGYSGLQRNHGLKTIEEELLIALKKIDVINEEEFRKQQLVNFQRAARTDKGVSALRQVINLSMREGVTPEELNQQLPEEIRVLAVKRVTKGFNSKNSCDCRSYSYTCPTFAFAPKNATVSEEYRMDDETFENLNKYSRLFRGTHNFYSFTSGRKPFDPSCKRHIINAEWRKPFVTDDMELIVFVVKGQSFMLHQIRKMVATLMAVCRGKVEPDYITKALNPSEASYLPTAPGVGLLLEQVHYDWYNKKYGSNGFHEKLDFAEAEEEVENFRRKHIYPMIINAEKNEKSMLTYLQTLDAHYEEDRTIKPEDEEIIDQSSAEVQSTELKPSDDLASINVESTELESSNDLSSMKVEPEELKSPDDLSSVRVEPTESKPSNESSSPLPDEKLTRVSTS